MIKKIVLKLKSVKYSGNSIGDDIRIETSILGKFFSLKKKIKVDTKQDFDKIIAEFDANQTKFEADINIRVIEDDPIFNDVGNLKSKIKIDTTKKNREFVYEVVVHELRVSTSKARAVFKITLQAEVLETETYISETSDGWLVVDIGGIEEKQSLPAFLKVELIRSNSKRDYFKILEGFYKGKSASVVRKSRYISYLQSGILVRESFVATYSISTKILTINNKKYTTTDFEAEKWEVGVYDIEIPDAPHKGGTYYLDKAKFAKVWFRIDHKEEKYLHTGRHSLGCITVLEQKHWDEIFHQIIKARKGDDISVGVLEVIN